MNRGMENRVIWHGIIQQQRDRRGTSPAAAEPRNVVFLWVVYVAQCQKVKKTKIV
jgi:hypothetical protein